MVGSRSTRQAGVDRGVGGFLGQPRGRPGHHWPPARLRGRPAAGRRPPPRQRAGIRRQRGQPAQCQAGDRRPRAPRPHGRRAGLAAARASAAPCGPRPRPRRRVRADGQRRLDPGDDVGGGHVPVQQQDLDQDACRGGLTVRAPGRGPQRLVGAGERPGGAGLVQRDRPGQRSGLADQRLQVVIQDERLAARWRSAARGGRPVPSVEDDQLESAAHPHLPTDQPDRNRVPVHPRR